MKGQVAGTFIRKNGTIEKQKHMFNVFINVSIYLFLYFVSREELFVDCASMDEPI